MTPEDMDRHVALAQGGDRAAFREVVVALEEDLRIFLYAFQVSEGLAEEVLQATVVTAFRKLHLYRPARAFRAWVKAIARNRLVDELREQRRFAASDEQVLEELLVETALADLDDSARASEVEAEVRRLRDCLGRLLPEARRLVEARYLGGEPLGHLARKFKRTEVWVRVNLFRVRKTLRTCMQAPAGGSSAGAPA